MKTALITGSTSGIGLAIADALSAAGWRIALHGLGTANEIANAVDQVASRATHADLPRHFDADLRTASAARRLIADVEDSFGHVDLLVNNAGIQFTARVEDFPITKWDDIIAINLSSVFHTCAAVLPGMRERDYGRIINMASVHGLIASTEKAAYVAAKHGVVGLTKTIALENAKSNVTCNAICPGWVKTALLDAQIDRKMGHANLSYLGAIAALLSEKEPSERFTTPEHIAAAVLFLVGEAGSNITGISLPMDGGWTAQ
ncbi:3-hydroxybutyrate dehydrogenase [Burkholderia sp. Bp9012]|uniref:3-hydroxybutyrate dehydrogenase n=2 Tax=Burkholderia TaxID=32008 RepID=UPI0021AB60DB|nr:3-hydroxybutyrate dehydrogenase [Burkholderia sp. Bp9012]